MYCFLLLIKINSLLQQNLNKLDYFEIIQNVQSIHISFLSFIYLRKEMHACIVIKLYELMLILHGSEEGLNPKHELMPHRG